MGSLDTDRPDPTKTGECVEPDTTTYQGVTFVVNACRDWSPVTPATPADAGIPVWPIPNIDLLNTLTLMSDFLILNQYVRVAPCRTTPIGPEIWGKTTSSTINCRRVFPQQRWIKDMEHRAFGILRSTAKRMQVVNV